MEKELILPEDFDGTFRFTNYTEEEFKARWDNQEYVFPPKSRTPMTIMTATPLEIQSIRKKFARELAIQEWYKSEKFKRMNEHVPGGTPALYTDSDIAPFVQRCLEPLPAGRMKIKELPRQDEKKLMGRDAKGRLSSTVVDGNDKGGESLVGDGTVVA